MHNLYRNRASLDEELLGHISWTSTTHHTAMHGILSSWLGWLQNCICRNVGHSIAASLEPFVHHQNVASLSLFYRYYFVHLNWLNWFHFLIHKGGLFVFSDRLLDFSVTIHRFYKGVYINSFYPCIDRLWNSLPNAFLWHMI